MWVAYFWGRSTTFWLQYRIFSSVSTSLVRSASSGWTSECWKPGKMDSKSQRRSVASESSPEHGDRPSAWAYVVWFWRHWIALSGLLKYVQCSGEKPGRNRRTEEQTGNVQEVEAEGHKAKPCFERVPLIRLPEMESNYSQFLWKASLGFANSIKLLVNFHLIDPGGLKLWDQYFSNKAGARQCWAEGWIPTEMKCEEAFLITPGPTILFSLPLSDIWWSLSSSACYSITREQTTKHQKLEVFACPRVSAGCQDVSG